MAGLFESTTINTMTLANRFVRSAIWMGMANEDGSVLYTTAGVTGRRNVHIDRAKHPDATQKVLAQAFRDLDGDGIRRLLIYDYGPGDTVTVPNLCVTKGAPHGDHP